jgi:hypothetical protein
VDAPSPRRLDIRETGKAIMSRNLLGVVLLLLGSSAPVSARDDRAFKVGPSDVVFEEAAPMSSDAELKRRFRATDEPPPYDLAREKFRLVIPATYHHDTAWGLFVWVDASPQPNLSTEWGPILAEKKLLYVGAYNTGNGRNMFDRCRLAVDAVHNMKARFHVDPDRVYVSGGSGGGRVASTLGVAYGDVFAGTFAIVGVNFYKPIPTGEPNKAWLPHYQPEARVLESARARDRYVLLTGEKDFNRENTLRVYRAGFQAENFRHVLYLEVPGMGHNTRPPADWFVRGIEFLDQTSAPRQGRSPAGGAGR